MRSMAVLGLFEPPRRRGRIILISGLEVLMLAILGIAFLLLDFVFRDLLAPQDVMYIRLLMVASWLAILILEVGLAFLKGRYE